MKQAFALLSISFMLIAGATYAAEKGGKKALVDEVSGQGYGMAGCGLGSIIFGAKPGIIQVVAATFNATSGNQTFGITSGTLNCVSEEEAKHATLFIIANRVALQNDISRGNGETLTSLASVMGCQDANLFSEKLQGQFSSIFPDASVNSEAVAESIFGAVRSDEALLNNCGYWG